METAPRQGGGELGWGRHSLQKLKTPKRRLSRARGNEEEGLVLRQNPLAGRCVEGEVEELRAGPRGRQASSDSRHHPCRQWRFPGKW